MSARPLAETYEELKELRRKGSPEEEINSRVGESLPATYTTGQAIGLLTHFWALGSVGALLLVVAQAGNVVLAVNLGVGSWLQIGGLLFSIAGVFLVALNWISQLRHAERLVQCANLVRTLEIKTLANRVFGDEDKAKAWLQRPNQSLSQQRPHDLLKDELGTTVVREMLERIDHGIYA